MCHVNCVDVIWCAYQNIKNFRELELPCMNFFSLLRVDALPEFIWGYRKKNTKKNGAIPLLLVTKF